MAYSSGWALYRRQKIFTHLEALPAPVGFSQTWILPSVSGKSVCWIAGLLGGIFR
jgi:hypothetical protein